MCACVGPKACKNPDTFMAPLVEELQELWRGVSAIDVTADLDLQQSRSFTLRGILLWTMHDWPGLGSCSGLKVSGYGACHKCGPTMVGRRSIQLKKVVYHEHRRWLPMDHPFRRDRRHWRHVELGTKPIEPTLEEWRTRLEEAKNGRMTMQEAGIHRWSILYDLPYWDVRSKPTFPKLFIFFMSKLMT